jgi:hypothetical protein
MSSTVIAGNFSDNFPMSLEVETDPDTGMKRPKCPAVAVGFGYEPALDKAKTKEAGHPVYKDVEFVKIAVPGDKQSLYFQPATDRDRIRFPESYAAFKNRSHTVTEGMPVEHWAVISRSMAATLRACHIHTVEALAAVHDGHIDKLGFNARQLRSKAQAWLAQAKEGAASQKIADEKEAVEARLKNTEAQLAQLMARLSPQEKARLEAEGKPVAVAAAHKDATADVEQDVAAAARRPRARVA